MYNMISNQMTWTASISFS